MDHSSRTPPPFGLVTSGGVATPGWFKCTTPLWGGSMVPSSSMFTSTGGTVMCASASGCLVLSLNLLSPLSLLLPRQLDWCYSTPFRNGFSRGATHNARIPLLLLFLLLLIGRGRGRSATCLLPARSRSLPSLILLLSSSTYPPRQSAEALRQFLAPQAPGIQGPGYQRQPPRPRARPSWPPPCSRRVLSRSSPSPPA